MNTANRWLLVVTGIVGASGVATGAFAAHGLAEFLESQAADPELIAKRLAQFDTGVRYHLLHAVALLAISVLDLIRVAPQANSPETAGTAGLVNRSALRRVTTLFLAGICLFSGSLYLLVLTNTPWLGAITPIGGVAWIIAWLALPFCLRKA